MFNLLQVVRCVKCVLFFVFFFQAEDGIRDAQESRGLGDVYKRQPKGTPADVQARIVEDVKKAGLTDDAKLAWANNGAEFGTLTPAQFGSFVSNEVKRWAAVVKTSGAKLD